MNIEVCICKKDSSAELDDLYNGSVKLKGITIPKFRWLRILSCCCGVVSIITCLIVLAICKPRTNLELDYLGAIVATVSLVVAVFVAVQIYQSFNLRKDIDVQNKKLINEVSGSFSNKISEFKNDIKELQSLRSIFDIELEKSKKEILGKNFIDTLSLATFLKGITSNDYSWRIKTCFSSYYATKFMEDNITNLLSHDFLMLYLSEAVKSNEAAQKFYDIQKELEAEEVEVFMNSIPNECQEKNFLTKLLNRIRNANSDSGDISDKKVDS